MEAEQIAKRIGYHNEAVVSLTAGLAQDIANAGEDLATDAERLSSRSLQGTARETRTEILLATSDLKTAIARATQTLEAIEAKSQQAELHREIANVVAEIGGVS